MRALLVVTVLTLTAACDAAAPDPRAGGQDPDTYATRLVEVTNEARASLDLPELSPSTCAERAARDRAEDLLDEDELAHAPLGEVTKECAPGARAAENLVDSDASPPDVVEAWMGSPGHRNNIVDPALREIGIGCVESDKGMLCSQLFLGDR